MTGGPRPGPEPGADPVPPDSFRDAMAGVCSPVTIVTTTTGPREPRGATVSAFASLSLDPPMVSVALSTTSTLLRAIVDTGRFGINVLSEGQQHLAVRFSQNGIDRFAGVPWEPDHDLPRLGGAGTWIVCDLAETARGGDHVLLLGTVRHTSSTPVPPLIYARRSFGTHSALTGRATTP